MQITSYDANLSFFYRWIYNLRDYSTYKVIINVFFALNLKICRILLFMIRSYDLRSHLPSTILHRIPILTTLVIRQPSKPLTPMNATWPFAQWKLDIMGPFPMAMRQLKFLVIEIDYFIKWVEIEPLTTITEKNARSFVWKRIICRFGIPRVLISDNGKQFNNDAFRDFCN